MTRKYSRKNRDRNGRSMSLREHGHSRRDRCGEIAHPPVPRFGTSSLAYCETIWMDNEIVGIQAALFPSRIAS